MVYQWKLKGMYKVDAQAAGEELERISASGSLTPEGVVTESRLSSAVLHDCFDWNDATAAESYRAVQAREIIRSIVTIRIDDERISTPVRAFVSIEDSYIPMDVVVKNTSYKDEMLHKALHDLQCFQRKYQGLEQLSDVFECIARVSKKTSQPQQARVVA